jgi:protein SCO1/2
MALVLGLVAFASAQDPGTDSDKNESPLARSMGITQKLGETLPKDVEFKDETGKTVRFGDLFSTRPVVLIPMFYACRTGCELITDSVLQTLAKANKTNDEMIVGRDLDVIILGIHPKETPELALAKKNLILKSVEPPRVTPEWKTDAQKGWHLLTGDLESIHKITDAIGFKYSYDPIKDLINHPTCTVILTPQGRISSYTIGTDFPTSVIKSDLEIAARNEVGEKADQTMMFGCIMLDPATHKYTVVVENVLRLAGVLTVIILAFCIIRMSITTKREERERDAARARTAADDTNHRLGTSH